MRTHALTAAAVLVLVAGTATAQRVNPIEDRQGTTKQPEWRQDGPAGTVISRRVQARPELVPVDWIVGTGVLGEGRERLGEVSDLVIDAQRGRVLYGLLEHGGMLGMGERHVAIPWRTFDWDPMNRVLTLPLSTDRLSSAPRLDRDDWQRLSEPQFRTQFDEFLGKGGWGDGAAHNKYNDLVRRSQAITVRGTIRAIELVEPVAGVGNERALRIQTDDGNERVVVVGPQWFVDRQRQLFQEGQQVQVTGVNMDLEGSRELVVAKSINTPQGSIKLRDDDGKGVWDLGSSLREEKREERREVREDRRENRVRDDSDRRDERGQGLMDPRRTERGTILRARDIKGQRVTDDDNNDIGRVDTFLINPENGKLGYAVITVGGFLGVGDEKYAVPWRSFNVNQQGKLVAKLDKEQLRTAPKIETRNWSELQDPEFGKRVFQHYGAPADWDRDDDNGPAIRDDRNNRDSSRDNARDNKQADDRLGQWDEDTFVRLFADGASTDFTGSVVRIDRSGRGGVVDLVVRTDAGERVVKLLPQAAVDKAILNLDEGDRITVHGKSANIEGRRVIIARDVEAEGRTYQLRDEFGRPEVRVRR
jgi:sporulation protein YlmC with PRC-barrel domain